jgi:hypothetical protein
MQITKEFLIGEIADLDRELQKASTFVVQAQATISAYQMLLRRLEEPEPVESTDSGAAHG